MKRAFLFLVPVLAIVVAILLLFRELYLIGVPLLIAGIALSVALRQQDKQTSEVHDDAG